MDWQKLHLINRLRHFSTKDAEHPLVLQMCCFSMSYMIVNLIYLGFRLSYKNNPFEYVTLGSGESVKDWFHKSLPPMMAESLLTPSGITLSSLKGNSASEYSKKKEKNSNHPTTHKQTKIMSKMFYIHSGNITDLKSYTGPKQTVGQSTFQGRGNVTVLCLQQHKNRACGLFSAVKSHKE